jgi:cell division septal protein FtsQ
MAEGAVARRRRHSQMLATLKRLFIYALASAAVAAVAFVVVKIAMDPAFQLGSVSVAGAARTSEEDVLRAAALPAGRNIWFLDTASAAARMESLPWVRSASIERQWPNVVTIAIAERVAAARVLLLPDAGPKGPSPHGPAPQYALVDAELRVLAVEQTDERDAALPLLSVQPVPLRLDSPGSDVRTPELAQALDAAQRLIRLGVRISEVESRPATGIGFTTASRLRVLFGTTDDMERKVALLAAISKRIVRPDEVAYVDLRSAAAPTVEYR